MRALGAAVVVLVGLVACGGDPATDAASAPATATATATAPPTSGSPAARTPPGTPTPVQTAEETAWEDLPPELAAAFPETEVEMDELVLAAEEAYRAHRALYDAAAATGFTDPALVEELRAGAGRRTREYLEAEMAAVADAGYTVDGGAEVRGVEVFGISPPTEDWPGIGVVLDVCLEVSGTVRDRDGTAVHEVTGGQRELLRVRLMAEGDGWLVVEQTQQEGPCPPHLDR